MNIAILAFLPFSCLLFAPMAFEEFEQPKALAIIAFSLLMMPFISWRKMFLDSFFIALLIFFISALVSNSGSLDHHMSIWGNPKCPCGVLVIGAYVVLYAALRQSKAYSDAVTVFLWCGALISIYGMFQVCGFDFMTWNGVQESYGYIRPMSTLGHPNFMAGFLAMLLPFALSLGNRRGFSLATLFLVAIFFSQSRGMWIATAAGLGFYFWMRPSRSIVMPLLICIIISLGAIVARPSLRETFITRAENVISPGPARLEYWKAAIRIWKRYPIFGSGTDTYEIAFDNQRTSAYWAMEKGGSPHKAHNDFLNVLATQGIFGAWALCLVAMAAIHRMVKASKMYVVTSKYQVPATAALIAFFVETISSFTTVAVGTMFLLCVCLLDLD